MASSFFTAPGETYFDALQNDTWVKLTIGTEPVVTFHVPKSTIRHCWMMWQWLEDIERPSSSSIPEPMSSSAGAKPSKTKPGKSDASKVKSSKQSPGKKLVNLLSPTKKSKEKSQVSQEFAMPEIKLPHDDPMTWYAFLYWSGTREGALPDDVLNADYKLVRCWNFAWKTGFQDFADDVMIALIAGYDSLERTAGGSITKDAVREAYCIDDHRPSPLKELICEEVLKCVQNECPGIAAADHEPRLCKGCQRDVAAIMRLKCPRKPSNPHEHHEECPVEHKLVMDVMRLKKERASTRETFRDRLTKLYNTEHGVCPTYMRFLRSDKWEEVRKGFEVDPPKNRAPNRLGVANFGYRPDEIVPAQLGVLPVPED